jgi:ACS family D-galactonate transporter-like MFS transporter
MSQSKTYSWTVVAMLWLVALLNYMDRQILSTMKNLMQSEIIELQSATYFGYLMAIFLWVYGLMSPFSGIIADRLNRKYLIVGSLFVWSTITLLMSYAQSFSQLYVLRATMGVSEALYIPAALSLIADYHDTKTRSLAIGLHMTGLYMGQALGGFGATIAAHYSWQHIFFMLGLIGIVYSFVLIFFLKEIRTKEIISTSSGKNIDETKVAVNLNTLFKNPSFWLMLIYFTIPSLPGWGVKNWLPTLFAENLSIKMELAGPISTVTTAGSSFLGVIFGGIISDKWVQKNIKGRIYTSAIGLALTVPALLLIGLGHSMINVLGAAFCFGFGFGMFDANNMPIICQLISPKQRATAYGFMNMTGVFAGAIITNFLGKSTDGGHLGRDFAVLSGFVLIAIMMQLYFLRPELKSFEQ